jgi:hypothetical protein
MIIMMNMISENHINHDNQRSIPPELIGLKDELQQIIPHLCGNTMTTKDLSLIQFQELPQELQFKMLRNRGVYVGKRKDDDQVIILFQLHGFYVEIYYKEYRKVIDYVLSSDTTEILQPYLDQISWEI